MLYNVIIIILALIILILAFICINNTSKIKKMQKRFDTFAPAESDNTNIENMLKEFIEESREIKNKYEDIDNKINDIYSRLKLCAQKIGIIRYNPFDDVGGDLCFSIAILNENNDGIVINSIYSRDSCYIYAKSVVNGVCPNYKLSNEEELAINEAIKNSYGGIKSSLVRVKDI